mgnify:CR=1 FL=1
MKKIKRYLHLYKILISQFFTMIMQSKVDFLIGLLGFFFTQFMGIAFLVLYITNKPMNNNHNYVFSYIAQKVLDYKIDFSIVLTHLFDASTTYVAVEYFNYVEQHVLPNALNQLFDTYLTLFPMKIIVIVAVLYIIDQYFDDLTIKNLLKN